MFNIMNWYKVEFSKDQVAGDELLKLQIKFQDTYIEKKAPKNVTIFTNKTPTFGEVNLEHVVYFTPEAAQTSLLLIQKMNGKKCNEPSEDDISYLAGDANYEFTKM